VPSVLLGAVLAVFLGYRVTSVLGSLLVAAGFLVASFLPTSQEIAVTVLGAGVGGTFYNIRKVLAILILSKRNFYIFARCQNRAFITLCTLCCFIYI